MPNQTQIIHDMFQIKGGGERLILTLCEGLPADLVTAHVGKHTFDVTSSNFQINNLNALSSIHGIKTWYLARAFKSFKNNHSKYKQIIYSGVASPLAVHHNNLAKNIFYCHTPPRFVYDKKDHYAAELNPLKRIAFHALIKWFKPQYETAVKKMDVILCNSHYVETRIKQNLGLQSSVVHPPCDTKHFKWIDQGNYYLSLARHDKLKRIDKIIHAFKRMPEKKLIIASGGSETAHLKQLAAHCPNISFTGWLEESELLQLLGGCLATIYIPLDEDFGMTPVESMSAGKPVICSDHGGLLETMIEGETGFAVASSHIEHQLIKQVNKLSKNKAFSMKTACEQRAKDFDSKLFIKKIKEFL